MKLSSLSLALCATLLSSALLADECVQTCEQDYKDCKAVAESKTAKQACEDDVKECKAQCKM